MGTGSITRQMIRRDLLRDRGASTALLAVVMLSALLMASGTIVVERLAGASTQLFAQTRPPHFLQMHTGEVDRAALEDFAAGHPELDTWMIERTVGVDGSDISWHAPDGGDAGTLSDSLVDNLFVEPNEEFDLMLDGAGEIARPGPGEVYIPLIYQQREGLDPGDVLRIDTGHEQVDLTVAGTVRDGQMASSLSSSVRFVISAQDWQRLEAGERFSHEIIVEYRLTDPSAAGALQAAYQTAPGVPTNGQAVTIELIRLMYVISDGLAAFALIAVSVILLLIALLNIVFVIRGTLEDDVRQIGTLRAIGLPPGFIAGLYLGRFRVLAAAGCLLGSLAAVPAAAVLTRGLSAAYAAAPIGPATVLAPLATLVVVYLVIVLSCRMVLRDVGRASVVTALVQGTLHAPRRRPRRTGRGMARSALSRVRPRGVNRRLALLTLLRQARSWALLPAVYALAAIAVIVPAALFLTLSSPRFITFMGVPDSDLMTTIAFAEDLDAVRDVALEEMRQREDVTDVLVVGGVLTQVQGPDGWDSRMLEVGDHSALELPYLEGSAPQEDEVALSVLAADRYGVSTGQELTVRRDGKERTLRVSGIYQDITSGGFTMKQQGVVPEAADRYTIFADVADGADPQQVAAELDGAVEQARTIPQEEYARQSTAYLRGALRGAALLAAVTVAMICTLITLLFLRLQLTRERRRSGVLCALGFTRADVAAQVHWRAAATVLLGVMVGTVLAGTLGPRATGSLLSAAGLGLARLTFLGSPWLLYGVLPALLVIVGVGTARVLTARMRADDLSARLRG